MIAENLVVGRFFPYLATFGARAQKVQNKDWRKSEYCGIFAQKRPSVRSPDTVKAATTFVYMLYRTNISNHFLLLG